LKKKEEELKEKLTAVTPTPELAAAFSASGD